MQTQRTIKSEHRIENKKIFRLDFPEFRKLDAIRKRFLYVHVKVDSDMAVYSSFSSFLSLFRIFPLFYIILLSMS